jgi:hypothetical protein
MAVLFRHAALLHKRDTVSARGCLGRAAPGSWLKPYDLNLFRGSLIDVSRHCLRLPENHDQINRTGDVGQRGIGLKTDDLTCIWANRNHVIPGRLQVGHNRVTVARRVGAGANDGHRSGALQDAPMERFLSGHVLHERLSRPRSCIPRATSLTSPLDDRRCAIVLMARAIAASSGPVEMEERSRVDHSPLDAESPSLQ